MHTREIILIMKPKNKYRQSPIKYFDTSIKYRMPMLPESVGTKRFIENEVQDVECSIEQNSKDGWVRAFAEGYQDKRFMDLYFDWLLYTKYIRKEI